MNTEWVFADKNGGATRKDGLLCYGLRIITDEAKVPPITVHGLRHSHATWLPSNAVSYKIKRKETENRARAVRY